MDYCLGWSKLPSIHHLISLLDISSVPATKANTAISCHTHGGGGGVEVRSVPYLPQGHYSVIGVEGEGSVSLRMFLLTLGVWTTIEAGTRRQPWPMVASLC